ncbi:hypothetical protein CEF21_12540 [Bacillus sp. FJAT-42376]|uniref:hypothetical protein n=1 Tax=Bacillus sp. FJAT-42376 TaxID=2014076 RepID=UPI000F515E90|nr:hypothetical protein [Bacillus sp. FJAT-42376]AZB43066.1 hypothetical protein CEF21_12540 [Bacillus sp. FJAT-42376]
MAFGINKKELKSWKEAVSRKEIAFLTHFWYDDRFPNSHSVTKAGCGDLEKLAEWGKQFGLQEEWIDRRSGYPHFDLMGSVQIKVLKHYGMNDTIKKFKLE